MSERSEGRGARPTQETVRPPHKTPPARTQGRSANPYLRAENEDDDGYDPFSDRLARREPLFERDPWT